MSNPYVYKIECKKTGKIYIGARYSKKYIDSGLTPSRDLLHVYKSSSYYMKQLFKEVGIKNFRFEVVTECETVDDVYIEESKNIEKIWEHSRELSLNYCKGGSKFRPNVTKEFKSAISKRRKGSIFVNKDGINKNLMPGEEVPEGWNRGVVKEANGSFWVNDGEINKKIKRDSEVPEGFSKGRVLKNKGKKFFTNGTSNTLAFTCPEGFVEGFTKSEKTGKGAKGSFWANDEMVNIRVLTGKSIPDGFVRGRLIKQDSKTGLFSQSPRSG